MKSYVDCLHLLLAKVSSYLQYYILITLLFPMPVVLLQIIYVNFRSADDVQIAKKRQLWTTVADYVIKDIMVGYQTQHLNI